MNLDIIKNFRVEQIAVDSNNKWSRRKEYLLICKKCGSQRESMHVLQQDIKYNLCLHLLNNNRYYSSSYPIAAE